MNRCEPFGKNIDDKKMYFSLGAHPGFNIEVGDSLIFDENETLVTERIDKDSIIAVFDEQTQLFGKILIRYMMSYH